MQRHGQGGIVFDPSDIEDDSNACTLDGCSNDRPPREPRRGRRRAPRGTVCNGNVDCLIADTCPARTPSAQARLRRRQLRHVAHARGRIVQVQSPGDYQENVCDGGGVRINSRRQRRLRAGRRQPVHGRRCSGGMGTHNPVAAGTSCGPQQSCNADGACVGCLTNADCPGPDTECQTRACLGGVCGFNYAPAGTLVAAQQAGDCKKNVCNGAGAVAVAADDSDVQDDGNDCTDDLCNGGSPSHPAKAAGADCAQGGTVCNGAGSCGACVPGDSQYCCGVKTSFCCNNPAAQAPKPPSGPPNVLCCCGGSIDCDASGHWGPCQ
ncbi:MAG: hypothetical protein U0359_33780 [Byssovorax sp.]